MSSDLASTLDFTCALAKEAGQILMRVYATDFAVELKGRNDPVTLADKLANEHIVRALRERFPTDGIVAEETLDQGDALRGGRCWYVDPLDGTKEFVAKNGEFSVMIGLAIEGEARLGVVYRPDGDKLYAGAIDHGATLWQGGNSRALRVSEIADTRKLRLVVSRSHRSHHLDEVKALLGITEETPSGSVGLKVGLLAERIADLYVHASDKSSLWDACAPEALLRAAGGRFTGTRGEKIFYGGADMKNRVGILACNSDAYDVVLATLQEYGKRFA